MRSLLEEQIQDETQQAGALALTAAGGRERSGLAVQDPGALLDSAFQHIHALESQQGAAVICQAREQFPRDARVHLAAGVYGEGMNDLEAAAACYEDAHRHDPGSVEIAAARERIQYLKDGRERTLADGTYVGKLMRRGRSWSTLGPFGPSRALVRSMRHFYAHLGQDFEPTFWHKISAMGPGLGLFLAGLGGLFFVTRASGSATAGETHPAVAMGFLLVGSVLAVAGFKARAARKAFLDDVRRHFLDETGYQVADPDRGITALTRTIRKSNLGLMTLLYYCTGWMAGAREEVYELEERLDLPLISWWRFRLRSKMNRKANRLVEDALDRHWLFHLRNPGHRDSWRDGSWSDDGTYLNHLLRGESAEDFDFKPPAGNALMKLLRVLWFPMGLALGFGTFMIGVACAITLVFANVGQKLIEETAPAVMFLRKPRPSRGTLSVPVKNGLVIRSEVATAAV